MSNIDYAKHLVKEHLRERTQSIFPYLTEDVVEAHVKAVADQLVNGLLMESALLMSGALPGEFRIDYRVSEI